MLCSQFPKKKKIKKLVLLFAPTKRNTKLNCSHTAPFAMNYKQL